MTTALQERTPPESVREEMSKDRPSMFLHSEESTREFTSSAALPEKRLLRALRTLPSVLPMRSFSLELEMPILRLLKRKRKSREEPRPTDD